MESASSGDVVQCRIPAAFVLARVVPTSAELIYGYRRGWIDESDLVAIALAMYEAGAASPMIEELGLLLSDEYHRVSILIDDVESAVTLDKAAAQAWLFLALAWIYEHADDFIDPYETVESIYADFGYPPAIAGFVRFMPTPPGEPTGMAAMDARWRAYLTAETKRFRARPK